MIPIAKLKQNLDFNSDFGELIEIMKLASTLQFNQFRLTQEPFADFAGLLEKAISHIPADSNKNNILIKAPLGAEKKAIVLITSDEGFLGELSALLINTFTERRQEKDEVVVLGRQGINYLEELQIKFDFFASIGEKVDFNQVTQLKDKILGLFLLGDIREVIIIYARFISITAQQIEIETLLPIESFFSQKDDKDKGGEFLIEPDFNKVIEGWVKLWLNFRIYQIFWSSKLAEFSARIMHLEGSIQELNRMNQHLRIEYFKYLHGLSDKTIREISAARHIHNE